MGKLIILENNLNAHVQQYVKSWGQVVDLEFETADRLARRELFKNLVTVVRTTPVDSTARLHAAPVTSHYFAEHGLLLAMYVHS